MDQTRIGHLGNSIRISFLISFSFFLSFCPSFSLSLSLGPVIFLVRSFVRFFFLFIQNCLRGGASSNDLRSWIDSPVNEPLFEMIMTVLSAVLSQLISPVAEGLGPAGSCPTLSQTAPAISRPMQKKEKQRKSTVGPIFRLEDYVLLLAILREHTTRTSKQYFRQLQSQKTVINCHFSGNKRVRFQVPL